MALDRFRDGLYSKAEAARYLGVSPSTFGSWANSQHLVATVGAPRAASLVPFIGLAQAYTLKAFRAAGVPLQRIRPALEKLDAELGIGHALASKRLYTDGAEVLFDYSRNEDDPTSAGLSDLVVVRKSQPVFKDVIRRYLRRVEFDGEYAAVVPMVGYEDARLVMDVSRSFGQPIFQDGGAKLSDVLSLFRGGEPLDVVAEEFGLPRDRLEAALRESLRSAA